MEESETYCVRVGYNTLYLSTHDQQGFYHHLGYQDGPSVSGRRKCVTNLTENQVQYNYFYQKMSSEFYFNHYRHSHC